MSGNVPPELPPHSWSNLDQHVTVDNLKRSQQGDRLKDRGPAQARRSAYALAVFPGASYTAGWDATRRSARCPKEGNGNWGRGGSPQGDRSGSEFWARRQGSVVALSEVIFNHYVAVVGFCDKVDANGAIVG